MMRMSTRKRLPGRPKEVDGKKIYKEVDQIMEIPDAIYDIMDGLCTYQGWRWEDPKIHVLRLPENAVNWAKAPEPEPADFPNAETVKVIGPVKEPTMANTQFDPFAPFKEDENLWYYRGLNTKPASLRKRKAQGYEIVSDEARHGDLVLGRIPRELKQAREQKNLAKAAGQKEAVASQFKEAAARQGIETFEDQ